jgi:predicted GTPase
VRAKGVRSQFVNRASGSDLQAVGRGLKSCTTEVKSTPAFFVNQRRVMLLDTPGFDDTDKSDFDILEEIAKYLTSTYVSGLLLIQMLIENSDIRKRSYWMGYCTSRASRTEDLGESPNAI